MHSITGIQAGVIPSKMRGKVFRTDQKLRL